MTFPFAPIVAMRSSAEQARVMFLVSVACGLRRGELLGLRWRHVEFVDMVIRIEETWVRARFETPKSEAGERTIAISQVIGVALFDHRGRSAFDGDYELVFCHPETGKPVGHQYPLLLRERLKRAKVDKPVRPVPRRHTHRDHQRCRVGELSGRNPGARRAHEFFDDPALHRPRRRQLPRRGRAALSPSVRRGLGQKSGQK